VRTEERHWITNPAGHRAHLTEHREYDHGDEVDTPFGPAVVIDTTGGLALDAWICDWCNSRILTRWGTEPFPVAADGGDALCHDCQQRVETGPQYSDRDGEPIPHTTAGPWPPQGCGCPPCRNTTATWAPYFVKAFELGWRPA
jgi:hypothetical protein